MTDQTQGASGADTGASGGSDGLPSAADILAFDPFGPAETPASSAGAGGDTPKPADATGGGSGKTEPAPAPAAQPLKAGEKPPVADPAAAPDPNATPATPATTPATLPASALEQLIRDQTAAITAAISRPAEPAAGSTPAPKEEPAKYNLGIPPQVVAMLRSEDEGEFANGMNTIINGIANRIWQDVGSHLDQVISQRVPGLINQHASATSVQQRVATDFYGKYETLRDPALRPLIQSVGVQIANERTQAGKSNEWSEEIRDAIAERVFTAIPQLRPAAPAGSTTPPGGGNKPPGFATGGGSRPPQVPDASAEFRELLQ